MPMTANCCVEALSILGSPWDRAGCGCGRLGGSLCGHMSRGILSRQNNSRGSVSRSPQPHPWIALASPSSLEGAREEVNAQRGRHWRVNSEITLASSCQNNM